MTSDLHIDRAEEVSAKYLAGTLDREGLIAELRGLGYTADNATEWADALNERLEDDQRSD